MRHEPLIVLPPTPPLALLTTTMVTCLSALFSPFVPSYRDILMICMAHYYYSIYLPPQMIRAVDPSSTTQYFDKVVHKLRDVDVDGR